MVPGLVLGLTVGSEGVGKWNWVAEVARDGISCA